MAKKSINKETSKRAVVMTAAGILAFGITVGSVFGVSNLLKNRPQEEPVEKPPIVEQVEEDNNKKPKPQEDTKPKPSTDKKKEDDKKEDDKKEEDKEEDKKEEDKDLDIEQQDKPDTNTEQPVVQPEDKDPIVDQPDEPEQPSEPVQPEPEQPITPGDVTIDPVDDPTKGNVITGNEEEIILSDGTKVYVPDLGQEP